MADSQPSTPRKTENPGAQTMVLHETQAENAESSQVLQLRLQQPKNEHKVRWSSDTVDNELMGKKKSKCCCIYEKPKVFGESDTSSSSDENDDDDDGGCTPHCRGHKKKCYRRKPHDLDQHGPRDNETGPSSSY